jgi:hypothetical protein
MRDPQTETRPMLKRLLPIFLASAMCVLPPRALASLPGDVSPNRAAPAVAVVGSESGSPSYELSDADREVFRLAQQSSDPDLGQQRGGGIGLLVLILLVVLIVLLVDHA